MRREPRADILDLGARLRTLRLERAMSQERLSDRANVSLGAVQALEAGRGSSLATLARVLAALDVDDWVERLAPKTTSFNPLTLIDGGRTRGAARRRAPRRRKSTPL